MLLSRQNNHSVALFLWGAGGFLLRGVFFGVIPLGALATALSQFDIFETASSITKDAVQVDVIRTASHMVRKICLADDGRTALIVRFPAIVQQVDLQTGEVLATTSVSTAFASDLQLTSSRLFATVYETERGIVLHSFDAQAKPRVLPTLPEEDSRLAVDPVRDVLAISHDRTIELQSLETNTTCSKAVFHDKISRMQWSADGSRLLVVLYDGTLHILDGRTLALSQSLPTSFVGDTNVIWAHDGQHAAICANDGSIVVWDLAQNESRHFGTNKQCVRSMALSPDGRWIAYSDEHDQIWLQAVEGPQKKYVVGTSPSLINVIVFAVDGQSLLIGGMDGRLESWSLGTGGAEWSLPFDANCIHKRGRSQTLRKGSSQKASPSKGDASSAGAAGLLSARINNQSQTFPLEI